MMAGLQVPNIREPIAESDGRVTHRWWSWFNGLSSAKGFSGIVATAKVTSGGANGSMTFQNGILVSQTPAT
jgi:hypothetical protein